MTLAERKRLILADLRATEEQKRQYEVALKEAERTVERLTGAYLLLEQMEREEAQETPA